MLGLIVVNILAWFLVYLIIKVEDKLLKAFFALILVEGIVYLVWAKPDYVYDFVRDHKTLTINNRFGNTFVLSRFDSRYE